MKTSTAIQLHHIKCHVTYENSGFTFFPSWCHHSPNASHHKTHETHKTRRRLPWSGEPNIAANFSMKTLYSLARIRKKLIIDNTMSVKYRIQREKQLTGASPKFHAHAKSTTAVSIDCCVGTIRFNANWQQQNAAKRMPHCYVIGLNLARLTKRYTRSAARIGWKGKPPHRYIHERCRLASSCNYQVQ